MSQLFPKRIFLHFPSEIYLQRGVGEFFPLLVRALHEKEIVAMQFLRGVAYGSPCALRPTERFCYRLSSVLKIPLFLLRLPIASPSQSMSVICPLKCPTSLLCLCFLLMVKCTLSSLCITEFPAICTGTRTVLMSVNDSVPSIVNVHGFECRVWYPGQPAYCSVRPAIYPGPVRSRAFAGAASSPVMWLGSVCRPGFSLVLLLL